MRLRDPGAPPRPFSRRRTIGAADGLQGLSPWSLFHISFFAKLRRLRPLP